MSIKLRKKIQNFKARRVLFIPCSLLFDLCSLIFVLCSANTTTTHTLGMHRNVKLNKRDWRFLCIEWIEGTSFSFHGLILYFPVLNRTGIGTFPETDRGVVSGSRSLISCHFCINQKPLRDY